MSEMEDKLNSVLGNPQMMQQIMSMAQTLSQSPSPQNEPIKTAEAPQIDLALVQKLSGLAGQSTIDSNQRALLQALHPYLSHNRVIKLEKPCGPQKWQSWHPDFSIKADYLC